MTVLDISYFILWNFLIIRSCEMSSAAQIQTPLINADNEIEVQRETPIAKDDTEPVLSKRALKRKLKHEKWLKWRPIKRFVNRF